MTSRLLKSGNLNDCPHEWEEWEELIQEDGPDPEDALWAKEICCLICGEHWAIL